MSRPMNEPVHLVILISENDIRRIENSGVSL
jgi:hypothetical protein